jgi:steroid delta-isomerase-like uncharacterized protein
MMAKSRRAEDAEKIWQGEEPSRATTPEENLQLVSRIWAEIWNKGILETSNQVFADEYYGHLPMMNVHGPEEFKGLVQTYRNAYPDVQLTIQDAFAAGDHVAVRWLSRGTHLGELMGVPPSGQKIEVMGISLFRISGGKVVEEWEGFDTFAMMQQIGAIPKWGQP